MIKELNIIAVYNSSDNSYRLPLKGIRRGNVKQLSMKFDSGAANTLISIYSFYNKTKSNKFSELVYKSVSEYKEKVLKTAKRLNLEPLEMSSASGGKMKGYLMKARDVYIYGKLFPEFFFYLTFDTERQTVLLGNDFISCCSFTHNIGGDIHITKYDSTKYRNLVASKRPNAICVDELLDIEDIQADLAAAFNDFIKNK